MQIRVFDRECGIDDSRIDADAEVIRERVREYEAGERTTFDFEIDYLDGFTGDVMRAMERIPSGETRTYGEIAADLETAPIAVGQACGRNPVPVVVPCHRIVGADSLTGYAGGLDLKRRLLEHEGAVIPGEP
ncbi:methylated-DNA/protein-cysteinemethyltransferase [Haloterrigena turkmenica DSM 5511]|uniref:Methylated-DNA/protein-cysteinemethyltransferase n=1 Tax=Haloterrigena turkmenica (strain ATCC 51198 / DSM 5511 / JCM 9101 / NCIMB 13204 / VKM B-1734 / 4k) TaxID=543526 RepID=D2RR84_HALTV|nr:methylated-DNA--[protein]-cysteine S-methyltransferase [Haloterrigena turkmenica]ADB62480.1 methylated-DNA/protein-cysteinemethyltransferase [Haloterrigena turkmenica DSM 5511]